jgi:hypothetical protein
MLAPMLRRLGGLRIAIALLAVLAVVVAGPIHAAHHHENDASPLHTPCAVCQLHSPACQPLLEPGAGVSLEPIFTLAVSTAPAFHSAPTTVAGTRAPPSLVA